MRKYHYLVLFVICFFALCPFALRALYLEREKNAEAFVETEASQEESGDLAREAKTAGAAAASGNEAVSGNGTVSESEAVARADDASRDNAVVRADAMSENGIAPGVDVASENGAASGAGVASQDGVAAGADAVSENGVASESGTTPGANAAPETGAAAGADMSPENGAVSGADAAPGNAASPGKETVPESDASSGKRAVPESGTTSEMPAKEEAELPPEEFFKDALFIGDSRTVGLAEYALQGSADVFATEGMNIFRLYSSKNSIKNQKGSFADVLAGKQYRKIYMMLGINELGFNRESALKRYEEEVLKIKELQPNAKIILEANLHVTTERSGWDKTFNNDGLNMMNDAIRAIAEKHGFSYIDINTFFDDETGGLNSAYSRDGIHLMGKYYQQWVDWIRKTGE